MTTTHEFPIADGVPARAHDAVPRLSKEQAGVSAVFERLESEVRSYCRGWPAVFDKASGGRLYDIEDNAYIDFFSGAGALNYGHNHPVIKKALLEYLAEDRVLHSLDMSTPTKAAFLKRFHETILEPRGLDYKVQFPGPTGTNAVEAALKLARRVTGREQIVSFTNAFHGMTLGSLSVTGNSMKRNGAGVPLGNATALPYCGFLDDQFDSIHILESLLDDNGSGLDLPAAVIVETVQGEGGVNVASPRWLGRIAELCAAYGILLIVDDVQMGCGRTGPFFSFEDMGIVPDIVTLAKSLSGLGLPLAVTLMRPELDVWKPGEHNGTFRGHNPAFVTATAALSLWEGEGLTSETLARGQLVEQALSGLAAEVSAERPDLEVEVRGTGMIWGLAFPGHDLAEKIAREAFDRGVLVETSGPDSDVVKLMPPLNVSLDDELLPGLEVIGESVRKVVGMGASGSVLSVAGTAP